MKYIKAAKHIYARHQQFHKKPTIAKKIISTIGDVALAISPAKFKPFIQVAKILGNELADNNFSLKNLRNHISQTIMAKNFNNSLPKK